MIEVTHTFGFFFRLFSYKNTQCLDDIQKLLNMYCWCQLNKDKIHGWLDVWHHGESEL
jgi:hypothetical protein